MAIKIATGTLDELECEGLVLGHFADERPPRGRCGFADWRLNGLISNFIKEGKITGTFLEKVLIPSQKRIPSDKILLIGLGISADLTYDQLYAAGYTISETVSKIGWRNLAMDVPAGDRCRLDVSVMTEAIATGYMDFCGEARRWPVFSTEFLADSTCLDGVVQGLDRFQRNAGDMMMDVDMMI
jgi:hypothetical protein